MKKVISLTLCILMLLSTLTVSISGAEVDPSETPVSVKEAIKAYEDKTGEKVETKRYYFLMPDGTNGMRGTGEYLNGEYAPSWYNSNANSAGVYWWGTNKVDPEGWPGFKMSKGDSDCVFYADIPDFVEVLVFNNYLHGGLDPIDPIYYDVYQGYNLYTSGYEKGDSPTYPDGLENFYDMIYVINPSMPPYGTSRSWGGEWFYYYGDGCYGTVKDGDVANCIRDDHNHDTDPHSSIISLKDAISQYEAQSGEKVNTKRYYLLMPNGENGTRCVDPECYNYGEYAHSWYNEYTDTPALYWWDEGVFAPEQFPGYTMEKGDSDGVFYAETPDFVTTLIFNNNVNFHFEEEYLNSKFNFRSYNVACEYYDSGESENYPDGTDSFENMIYVIHPDSMHSDWPTTSAVYGGEWYYYYGDGCYGTVKDGDVANCLRDDHYDDNGNHITNEFIVGDVDVDGEMSIMDATEIQLIIAQLKPMVESTAIADVDGDGQVSIFDATAIQLKLAGLE